MGADRRMRTSPSEMKCSSEAQKHFVSFRVLDESPFRDLHSPTFFSMTAQRATAVVAAAVACWMTSIHGFLGGIFDFLHHS